MTIDDSVVDSFLDAASDPYACLHLYDVLEGKRKKLDPTPPRPSDAELNLPIRLANGQTVADYLQAQKGEDAVSNIESHPSSSDSEEEAQEAQDPRESAENESSAQKDVSNHNARISAVQANDWVLDWQANQPQGYVPKTPGTNLRSYALWHEQGATVKEITLTRKPPSKISTVVAHIYEAVIAEKLPVDVGRWQHLSAMYMEQKIPGHVEREAVKTRVIPIRLCRSGSSRQDSQGL